MRIAHLSDPHLLDLQGLTHRRLLTKRLTGWVNLKLHRGSKHRSEVVEAMVEDIRARRVDHVVITGDLTTMALEREFERARDLVARLGLTPDEVSIVPGNHDVYTRGAERSRRFVRFFGPNITSDLSCADDATHPSGPFPFVRLRGPVAFVGLSTAVARLPLVASGSAGGRQLRALADALAHPEVRSRTPVVLMHHPMINPSKTLARMTRGLSESSRLLSLLGEHRTTLLLHGHLHDRAHRVLQLANGSTLHHLGATSASLLHVLPDRMSGYNVYDIEDDTLASVSARVWDASARRFVDASIRQKDHRFAD